MTFDGPGASVSANVAAQGKFFENAADDPQRTGSKLSVSRSAPPDGTGALGVS